MQILFGDFETYYDQDYSLRKMTAAEYIADPRFEALGCGFVPSGGTPYYVEGPELPEHFRSLDWKNIYFVSHNALFDALVLSIQYKVFPKRYGDTMAMARNWVSHSTGGVSLDVVSQFFGLPPKWNTLTRTKGVNFQALCQNPQLRKETAEYGIDDTLKCQFLFNAMLNDGFPLKELDIIDMVIRMAALPKFVADKALLAEHAAEIAAEKQALLDRCGMENRDNLMRDEALAAMLIFEGADVPMKISKTTGKEMFAFAKTDKEFTELLDHDNPRVQAIVAARLGHKSTLEETRTQRFIAISNATPLFPIPLKYSGAHTHRFSGDWSINAQNLPNDNADGTGGKLRKALKAPKGKKVIAIDASQIEARINACLSGQLDLLAQFAAGEDVYASFAEKVYKYPVTKATHPKERNVGKTGILSLGYSSSAIVFQNMVRVKDNIQLTMLEAANVVEMYRFTYKKIVDNWYRAQREILPVLAGTLNMYQHHMWGPLEVKPNKIILPNGNALRYRDIRYQHDEASNQFKWIFMRGKRPIYTYGAKIVENVVQALAFVHIMEVAHRVAMMTDYQLLMAHQVHDELIYIEDEGIADQVGRLVQREMSVPPVWMPDIPLAASYAIGDSYGGAKG